jgi:outer membrane biosynthesis protein TonB
VIKKTRVRAAVWASALASCTPLVGCGASETVQGSAATPVATVAEGDAAIVPSQEAGPTTTTTVALGSGGNHLEGSKLTSTSTQDLDSTLDGGARRPRSAETGRGPKDIQAIVVAHRDEARACYDAAIKAHPGIEGNLDVEWTIDPKGNVTEISVDTSRSDILEPTVGTCVIAIIKQIHFNESAKGFETRTHYPFNFHPRSGGVLGARPDGGGR